MQGLERVPSVLEDRLTPVNTAVSTVQAAKKRLHATNLIHVLRAALLLPQLQLHDVTRTEKDKAEHIGALPPPSFARNCGLSGMFFEQAGRQALASWISAHAVAGLWK